MKAIRKITALVLALITALSIFTMSASAASKKKKAPLSIKVETSASSADYLGMITVTVTVKNTSSAKVSNIIVSSSDSVGLVMYKPKVKNVVITNPGKVFDSVGLKSNAMTTCLLPGGTMKYTYNVLMGYNYSRRSIPETTSKLMIKQHKALKTKYFRDISPDAPKVSAQKVLKFGDVYTGLVVRAYYSVSTTVYDSIASNGTKSEAYNVTTERSSNTNGKSGIDPNFKKWVDTWEKWMITNLYVVEHADEFSTSESIAILLKYAEYAEELSKYESDETLTDEEYNYLISAEARVLAYEATLI